MNLAPGFALFDTPVGVCAFAWSEAGALVGAHLPEDRPGTLRARWQRRHPDLPEFPELPAPMAGWADRLRAVMGGARDTLDDIPLDLRGVPEFHRRVYAAARAIPPGQTRTYGQLAAALGEPGAARAVGQALGLNPFAPVVPCHRILAAGGRPGGFSAPGGVHTKLRLLTLERACFGDQPGLF